MRSFKCLPIKIILAYANDTTSTLQARKRKKKRTADLIAIELRMSARRKAANFKHVGKLLHALSYRDYNVLLKTVNETKRLNRAASMTLKTNVNMHKKCNLFSIFTGTISHLSSNHYN